MIQQNSDVCSIDLPPITKEQLIRYAEASTDLNPIHMCDKKAIEYGLPGVIAHGMLTMAFMGRFFGKTIQNGGFIKEFHARFKSKVFVGDQLTVVAEKENSRKNAGETRFDTESSIERYTIRVINQNSEEIAIGYVDVYRML
ncbi:dehydratase [bacterium LRH843]|nr:dehydratase [bacterium LRH843]